MSSNPQRFGYFTGKIRPLVEGRRFVKLGALARSFAGVVVARWRQLSAASASSSAGGVVREKQRTAASSASAIFAGVFAAFRRRDVAPTAAALTRGAIPPHHVRELKAPGRADTRSNGARQKHAYLVDGSGNTLDDGAANILHSVS